MQTYLHIGGLIAAGFDRSGRYLLAISHNGSGVFDSNGWSRVARDREPAYPADGIAIGIGPIAGQQVTVVEMDYTTERFMVASDDGQWLLLCESSGIDVRKLLV